MAAQIDGLIILCQDINSFQADCLTRARFYLIIYLKTNDFMFLIPNKPVKQAGRLLIQECLWEREILVKWGA